MVPELQGLFGWVLGALQADGRLPALHQQVSLADPCQRPPPGCVQSFVSLDLLISQQAALLDLSRVHLGHTKVLSLPSIV